MWYVDEDQREEFVKERQGHMSDLTLSYIVNRPMGSLSECTTGCAGHPAKCVFCSSFLECNVKIEKNQSHRLSKCMNADADSRP